MSGTGSRSWTVFLFGIIGSRGKPRRRYEGKSAMIRVGIFGLGTIGRRVCWAVEAGIPGIALAGGTGRDGAKAEAFLASLPSKPPFLPPEELIQASDLVLEAATQAALQDLAPKVLGAGKDLMVLSCGGLLGRSDWVELARRNRCRILVPSGAIAGLDGVKGARVGAITAVTMESRKPPCGWTGARYIEETRIDLEAIREETLIFEGTATEACRAFPANVNVVAALSLAGVGPERTRIKVFAVPGLARNTHRITLEGEFGRLQIQVENVPSENPRTGKLSYLSAIALLRDLGATVKVGT
ncbi:MAG: aspartate dehydrogenase [Candidatus Rokubacteria bacterium]|nr:aspartate dehydrogenase [Candidatus Rokubacteria bacterium]